MCNGKREGGSSRDAREGRKENMKEECGRIVSGRLFWLLLAAALAVNIWILWNFQGQQAYVETARNLAENGVESVTPEREEEIIEAFAGAEERYPGEVRVRNLVEGAGQLAERLKARDLAAVCTEAMKLTGDAAGYAEKAFEALESVLERNRRDGTARQFFVPCGGRFFELFSRWIPLAATAESILAAVLLMLKYVNEPFDRRTGAVVYVSKRGRKVNYDRFRAVTAAVTGFAVSVWAISLGMTAALFPLGKLWKVKLGSMMVLDIFSPVITRFPVNIGVYMVLQFLVSLCMAWLFGAMAYFTVLRGHNTFTAFGKMAIVCLGTAALTQNYPRDTILYFILRFNPVDFAGKAGRWFASGGTFLSFRGYEVLFLLFWAGVCGGLCVRRNREFLREDL